MLMGIFSSFFLLLEQKSRVALCGKLFLLQPLQCLDYDKKETSCQFVRGLHSTALLQILSLNSQVMVNNGIVFR
jgi:hypothetical protein